MVFAPAALTEDNKRMARIRGLSLRAKRLARELKRLRDASGVTLEQAAHHVEVHPGTLSKIENAAIGVKTMVVKTLLENYNVDADKRDELLQLSRDSRKRGWWDEYKDMMSPDFAAYIDFETEASRILNYEPQFIPGLLQTEEYARAVSTAVVVDRSPEEVEQIAKVRIARQVRFETPIDFTAILDEGTLRRPTGGPMVMAKQLEHIEAMAARRDVTVQVVPANLHVHPGMLGGFSLLEFPDPQDPDVVHIEGPAGQLYLEKPDDVRRCGVLAERLRSVALSPAASSELIQKIHEELT